MPERLLARNKRTVRRYVSIGAIQQNKLLHNVKLVYHKKDRAPKKKCILLFCMKHCALFHLSYTY